MSSDQGDQPPPRRTITGTAGSRIRVILGATGDDFLVVIDEDDGRTMWQSTDWVNLPDGLGRQLNNIASRGRYITGVDFDAKTGAWLVQGQRRDGTGAHAWADDEDGCSCLADVRNSSVPKKVSLGSRPVSRFGYMDDFETTNAIIIGRNGFSCSHSTSDNLYKRMNRIRGRKKQICFVRLFHDDAYFISDDEGTEWEGLSNSLTKNLRQNGEISDVALAQDGSWVVVRETRFSASTGVSSSLTQRLANFYSQHSQRVRQAREEQERFARQQEEAAAAEREREAALAREAEAAAAAAAEREREIAAREAEAAAERERERATALERLRRKAEQEGRILSEVLDGQQEIQVLEGVIRRRKRDLQEALDSLPQAQRARVEANSGWNLHESPNTDRAPSACRPECVICHDAEAERALVPCGHHCFCDECALQLMRTTRSCPLCRVAATSSLRIFSQRP